MTWIFIFKNLTQVFSSEICKIFKNTFFTEQPWWPRLKIQLQVADLLHIRKGSLD